MLITVQVETVDDKCLEFTNIEREELVALEVYVQMYVDLRRTAAKMQREKVMEPSRSDVMQVELDDEDDSDEDYSPGDDNMDDEVGGSDEDDEEEGGSDGGSDHEEDFPGGDERTSSTKRPLLNADADGPTKKSNSVTVLL